MAEDDATHRLGERSAVEGSAVMLIRMMLAAALVANASAAVAKPVKSLSLVATSQMTSTPAAPRASGGGVPHGGLYAIGLLVVIGAFVGVTAAQSDEADSD